MLKVLLYDGHFRPPCWQLDLRVPSRRVSLSRARASRSQPRRRLLPPDLVCGASRGTFGFDTANTAHHPDTRHHLHTRPFTWSRHTNPTPLSSPTPVSSSAGLRNTRRGHWCSRVSSTLTRTATRTREIERAQLLRCGCGRTSPAYTTS